MPTDGVGGLDPDDDRLTSCSLVLRGPQLELVMNFDWAAKALEERTTASTAGRVGSKPRTSGEHKLTDVRPGRPVTRQGEVRHKTDW